MAGRDASAPTPDETFMRRALELAREGWGRVAPNPMVGAVVVRDGEIVGEGAHREFGKDHAEMEALRSAGARARGATLYVSLEPCRHVGKTPPCTDRIVAAGIARVVAAVSDPNPEASGGAGRMRDAGLSVDVGVLADEARELNAAFFHSFGSDRPWVTLKLGISLDAAIAEGGRRPGWITGPEARRHAHHLRAGHDAVAVGMGTVLTDDPLLTVRDAPAPRVPPLRVVFSRSGRLPVTSRLAQRTHEAPVLVFAAAPDPNYEHALQELGVEVVGASSLPEAMRQLRNRGIRSVLVEGGATIVGALLADELVDRMVLYQAPILLGRSALGAFSMAPGARPDTAPAWRIVSDAPMGRDRMTVLAPARS
jgi:diaminohydroxyphosphoribosylaminopyrimidine deaminase/5-amino-6-(5-phosphoribosylamino)uracil reductase